MMATSIASPRLPSGGAGSLARLAVLVAAVRTGLERLDAWLAARRRAAQDRADLATMSERELADIGLPRASVEPAARGAWSRDPWV